MDAVLRGAGFAVLVMAVPLLTGLALGLALVRHRAIVAALGVLLWLGTSWTMVRGSEGDETNPPAWIFFAEAAVFGLAPYVFGLLVAVAIRSPRR